MFVISKNKMILGRERITIIQFKYVQVKLIVWPLGGDQVSFFETYGIEKTR